MRYGKIVEARSGYCVCACYNGYHRREERRVKLRKFLTH